MQPVLMIRSAVPGMVFINGRFAGEVSAESAASFPVGARGTLYIELQPLLGGYLPLARRIALSGGKPVLASVAGQSGLDLVVWPSGVLDMELAPERARPDAPKVHAGAAAGLSLRLASGEQARLELSRGDQSAVFALPDGALPPEAALVPGGYAMTGGLPDGGRYLLIVGEDLETELLRLSARSIELLDDGAVRALVDVGDQDGHAQRIHLARAGNGYRVSERESLWSAGAPSWPQSPEATALAALEAAMLNLSAEADAYFAPGGIDAASQAALDAAAASEGCVRLSYPLPDGRPAVGLVRLTSENSAEVAPVLYRVRQMDNRQGGWRLTQLELA